MRKSLKAHILTAIASICLTGLTGCGTTQPNNNRMPDKFVSPIPFVENNTFDRKEYVSAKEKYDSMPNSEERSIQQNIYTVK